MAKGGLIRPIAVGDETSKAPVDGVVAYSSPDLIDEAAVMKWLKVSKIWLADHRTRVEPIIPHLRLGAGTIRYSRMVVQRWLENLEETRPRWERPDRE